MNMLNNIDDCFALVQLEFVVNWNWPDIWDQMDAGILNGEQSAGDYN